MTRATLRAPCWKASPLSMPTICSILREAVPDLALSEARVIGGGARSTIWNQIKADVMGVPYQRLARAEFGSWGSAMIAGKAAGIFDDLAEMALAHARPQGPAIAARSSSDGRLQPFGRKAYCVAGHLQDVFLYRPQLGDFTGRSIIQL